MIIGFTGKMGSGKSTAISTLREAEGINGRPIYNVKFAQPLYDMQEYIYNRIIRAYEPPSDFVKDRKLLQWLGTDWGRNTISPTLWTDIWKSRVQDAAIASPDCFIVCDDVRFDNEAALVKSMGGLVVKLYGHDIQNTGILEHASEAGVSPELVDLSLPNTGNLGQFKSVVIDFHWDYMSWNKNTKGSK